MLLYKWKSMKNEIDKHVKTIWQTFEMNFQLTLTVQIVS